MFFDPSYVALRYSGQFRDEPLLLGRPMIRPLGLLWPEWYVHVVSPSSVGDLWIDFGWLGVLCGVAAVGFALQFLQLCFFKQKTPSTAACYCLLVLNGAWGIYGRLFGTMVLSVFIGTTLYLVLSGAHRHAERTASLKGRRRAGGMRAGVFPSSGGAKGGVEKVEAGLP